MNKFTRGWLMRPEPISVYPTAAMGSFRKGRRQNNEIFTNDEQIEISTTGNSQCG
jgi:hypothetical protein